MVIYQMSVRVSFKMHVRYIITTCPNRIHDISPNFYVYPLHHTSVTQHTHHNYFLYTGANGRLPFTLGGNEFSQSVSQSVSSVPMTALQYYLRHLHSPAIP